MMNTTTITDPPHIRQSFEERFWSKVNKTEQETGCWLWTGRTTSRGYASIRYNGSWTQVHRIAYGLVVGAIPEGLVIDHLCRVPRCVNPAHLEPVTQQINTLRGIGLAAQHSRQTHCLRGHPFDEENTRWNGRHRMCRACRREWEHRNNQTERVKQQMRERLRRWRAKQRAAKQERLHGQ